MVTMSTNQELEGQSSQRNDESSSMDESVLGRSLEVIENFLSRHGLQRTLNCLYDELRECEQHGSEGRVELVASTALSNRPTTIHPSIITSFFTHHVRPDRRQAQDAGPSIMEVLLQQHAHATTGNVSQTVARQAVDTFAQDMVLLRGDTSSPYPTQLHRTLGHIHQANVLSLCTWRPSSSSDGEDAASSMYLITGSTDRTVRITAWPSGAIVATLRHHASPVLNVVVHPNGRWLLTSAMDGSHAVMDLEEVLGSQCVAVTDNERLVAEGASTTPPPCPAIEAMSLAPRSEGPFDGVMQQWRDHQKYVVRATFSPCGNVFVTASYDHTARLYRRDPEVATPSWQHDATFRMKGVVESVCFSPDSRFLLLGVRDDHCLHVIDMQSEGASSMTSRYTETLYNMNANGDDWVSFTVMDMAFHPSGAYVVVMTDTQRFIFFRWHPHTLQPDDASGSSGSRAPAFMAHFGRPMEQCKNIYSIVQADPFGHPRFTWHSEGRYIMATDGKDNSIAVIDVVSGDVINRLEGHSNVIRGIWYDAISGFLFTGSFDKTVCVFAPQHEENVH